MSTDKLDVRHTEAAITNALRAHWKFFLIEGIVLLIMGAIAGMVLSQPGTPDDAGIGRGIKPSSSAGQRNVRVTGSLFTSSV